MATLEEMRAQLVARLASGVQSVDTPQLGKTEFPTVEQIQAAIAFLDSEIARGNPTAKTFVFQTNRGTSL